jgi:glycosyltransferase involved in cell wall biosynthesis
MKIGLLSFELTASGGEQRQILRLAQGLGRRGHEVTVYAYRYSPGRCFPELAAGLDIRALQVLDDRSLPALRRGAAGMVGVAARRYFLETRRLARALGQTEVLNAHSRPGHRAAVFAKRNTGTPVVWSCNDLVGWEQAGHRARMAGVIHRAVAGAMKPAERRIVRQVDAVAVLTEPMRRVLARVYGADARVIPAGVDGEFFVARPERGRQLRQALGIPQDAFLALWLGVLEPFRRLEDLLQAARLLRQRGEPVHCLIAGRGDFAPAYARQLEKLAAHSHLQPHLSWVRESMAEANLPDYYSACDVFVFPNDQQSWGLAPLEALSCSRPVVVSRGSGVAETLRDGENALLVPPRHPQALADAILRLKRDRGLGRQLARQGRRLVTEKLSWNGYVEQMAELLAETAEQHRRQRAGARVRRQWFGRLVEISEPLWRVR